MPPNHSAEGDDNSETPPFVPAFLLATLEDVRVVNPDELVGFSESLDCHELSGVARSRLPNEGALDTPELRVGALMQAVLGMHFKPDDRNEPFGPMMVLDGKRTAIPSDFLGCTELLALIAGLVSNPALRARFSDIVFLLDRKQGRLGLVAINAYSECVERVLKSDVEFRFSGGEGALHHDARDILQRALFISRAVGWDKEESRRARNLLSTLLRLAIDEETIIPTIWFSELDLRYGISDAGFLGEQIEKLATSSNALRDDATHALIELLRIAARAFEHGQRRVDAYRCSLAAAEVFVRMAQRPGTTAFLASSFLSSSIAQLHGLPEAKARRTELSHMLVDVQARISDEMKSFSQEIDLSDLVKAARGHLSRANLLEMLFAFASLGESPEPEKLIEEARDLIQKHPLSSLLSTSHLDREGKVVYRSEGGPDSDDAIARQIAQGEMIRRRNFAIGMIGPARQAIISVANISDAVLSPLIEASPFIPPHQNATFSHAFARFFQGDMASALYMITPLIESALRFVLKSSGFDVTIFDDATQTQQDRSLSSLFSQMRKQLEETFSAAIVSDLERVFTLQPGPHLRHALAHGLLHDGDPYAPDALYAVWLIFRISLLPLFPHLPSLRAHLEGDYLSLPIERSVAAE